MFPPPLLFVPLCFHLLSYCLFHTSTRCPYAYSSSLRNLCSSLLQRTTLRGVPWQSHFSLYSLQFSSFAEMGVIFTAVSKFIMAYISLVAAVSIWFFCNVTSLGIVCIRPDIVVKVLFCHFMAFVNYSGATVWVILGKLLQGIPVLILRLQDVYIYLIFVLGRASGFVALWDF